MSIRRSAVSFLVPFVLAPLAACAPEQHLELYDTLGSRLARFAGIYAD